MKTTTSTPSRKRTHLSARTRRFATVGLMTAWSLLVVDLIARARPDLLSSLTVNTPSATAQPADVFPHLEHFEPARGGNFDSPATFTHRLSLERTGYFGDTSLTVPIAESWRSEPLNVGIHGASKSSPAVDESGVYVGADSSWFYAFDHDGRIRWRFYMNRADHGIHATAALDADHVYIGAYNGRLYCLRKSDGSLVWSTRLADAIGSSVAVVGESVFATSETGRTRNGYAARLDRRTGRVLWQSRWLGEQVHNSPTLDNEQRRVFYGGNNGNFVALSSETGEEVWRVRTGKPIKGVAAFFEGSLFFANWAAKLYKLDATTGAVQWVKELAARSQSSPTIFPELKLLVVAAGDNTKAAVHAFRLDDGKAVWTRSLSAPSRLVGSGVGVRETATGRYIVWIPCEETALCALDARDGRELQKIVFPTPLTNVPAIHGDRLYVALDEGPLIAFSVKARKSK